MYPCTKSTHQSKDNFCDLTPLTYTFQQFLPPSVDLLVMGSTLNICPPLPCPSQFLLFSNLLSQYAFCFPAHCHCGTGAWPTTHLLPTAPDPSWPQRCILAPLPTAFLPAGTTTTTAPPAIGSRPESTALTLQQQSGPPGAPQPFCTHLVEGQSPRQAGPRQLCALWIPFWNLPLDKRSEFFKCFLVMQSSSPGASWLSGFFSPH